MNEFSGLTHFPRGLATPVIAGKRGEAIDNPSRNRERGMPHRHDVFFKKKHFGYSPDDWTKWATSAIS
jgi:hypothetical protein